MIVFVEKWYDGTKLVFREEQASIETILEDLRVFLEEEDPEKSVTIQITNMSREAFEELEEFQGF
mgnify:CR=1 FL=1